MSAAETAESAAYWRVAAVAEAVAVERAVAGAGAAVSVAETAESAAVAESVDYPSSFLRTS